MNRYTVDVCHLSGSNKASRVVRVAETAIDALEQYQNETPFGNPRQFDITNAKISNIDADTRGVVWCIARGGDISITTLKL